jgi:hypothetical protein
LVPAMHVGLAFGRAALATVAAAQTSAHDGSLVSGYRAAFLVAIGISVMAVLIVGLQMRARTIPDKLGRVAATPDQRRRILRTIVLPAPDSTRPPKT